MPNQWVRISKTTVENAPIPARGQSFLRDNDLKGFAVRLTSTGIDPIAECARQVQQTTALDACFKDFKKVRKHLSDKTPYDYDRVLRVALPDWRRQSISRKTPQTVVTRFRKLGEDRGEAYANLTMRCLRSLLNFALAQYDDGTGTSVLPNNPVWVLIRTRAWYKPQRRQIVIKLHELNPWHAAVESLRLCPVSDSRTKQAV
jgi:hypothetical protein